MAHGTQRDACASEGATKQFEAADPLDELRRRLAAFKAVHLPELPPFEGGAVGYAGYDVVRYVENLPNAPRDDRGLPDLSFAFYDRMVVFDNVSKTLFVIAMARLDKSGGDARAAYDDACRRVDDLVERLSQPTNLPPADIATGGPPKLAWKSNFSSRSSKTPFANASSTSRRAISFRSCSASGCRWTSAASRSSFIARCGS